MTTVIVSHPDFLEHVTPEGHPEQRARLELTLQALEPLNLPKIDSGLASDQDILRGHSADHIKQLRDQVPTSGFTSLDADTHMSPGSLKAAYRAVGSVLDAVDAVVNGSAVNSFAAVRPPGHHAETNKPMGFCLFGNVALGVKYALDFHKLKKVAVIDFDVHHGNGTQDLLWNEPRALTVTSQQMPLWPGTGLETETGGYNNVLNIPLPPESDGSAMRRAYEQIAFPRIIAFEPELIFISAGFDAHIDDPLAQLNWTTNDFAWLTNRICKLAQELCNGRLVSTLEGGYNLNALTEAVKAHVEVLMQWSKTRNE